MKKILWMSNGHPFVTNDPPSFIQSMQLDAASRSGHPYHPADNDEAAQIAERYAELIYQICKNLLPRTTPETIGLDVFDKLTSDADSR